MGLDWVRIRKGSYRRWKMHYRKAPSQRLRMMNGGSAMVFPVRTTLMAGSSSLTSEDGEPRLRAYFIVGVVVSWKRKKEEAGGCEIYFNTALTSG